ncbi:MAG: hypothetical protein LBE27_00300 [Deltaproteobacteria bacterium]|nr:hypothetical protein [Deltaproteobacteria bacterium]
MSEEILEFRDLERPRDTPGKPTLRLVTGKEPEAAAPSFTRAFVLGFLILALLYFISRHLGSLPFALAVTLVIAASLPIYISLSYFDSVKDALLYQNIASKGLIYRFVRRRLLSNIISALASILLATGLLLNLATLTRVEWPFVFLTLPLQLLIFFILYRLTRKELNPWHLSPYFSSSAASWLTPFLMILIYSLGMSQLSTSLPHLSPSEAVASQAALFPAAQSKLLITLNEWYAVIGGGRDFALGLIQPQGFWSWFLLNLIFVGTLFFSVSALLRLLTIPLRDLSRVSSATAMKAEKSSFLGFFTVAVLPALVVGLLFFGSCLKLELLASGEPGRKLEEFRQSLNMYLVMIDGEYYDSRIIQAMSDQSRTIEAKLEESKAELKGEVDKILNGYRANVDSYLDWYYSLPAEYGRLLTLVMGEIEEYMLYNMGEQLGKNVDTSGINKILSRLNAISSSVDLNKIKERYRYNGPVNTKPMLVLESKAVTPMGNIPIFLPYPLKRVASISAGITAGLAAGVLTKTLVVRIAEKIIVKAAIKAIAKEATKKGVSYGAMTAAGALGGATVGTVVPAFGNLVGAAVGALVGVGSAFLADKLILELDEIINRDEFRTSMLNSIEEQRIQIHKMIDDF